LKLPESVIEVSLVTALEVVDVDALLEELGLA
jgi:hypothetical protein